MQWLFSKNVAVVSSTIFCADKHAVFIVHLHHTFSYSIDHFFIIAESEKEFSLKIQRAFYFTDYNVRLVFGLVWCSGIQICFGNIDFRKWL